MAIDTRSARDGPEKKIKQTSRLPKVKVVKAKSVKPDPRVFNPGGETKMETKRTTHQMKVMQVKRTVR